MRTDRFAALVRKLAAVAASILFLIPAAAAMAAAAPAQPATSYALAPGGRLWLQGDSTLHPYSSTATKLEAAVDFDAVLSAAPEEVRAAVARGGMKGLSVSVPVAGLKSGEDGLDKNLRKALKEDKAPIIRFTLVDYRTEPAKDGGLLIKAHGRLAIAGTEKDATVEATCRFGADGIAIDGGKELLMSDFGIKPPTMMFGAIKTADKVVVHFELKLKAETPTAAQPRKENRDAS